MVIRTRGLRGGGTSSAATPLLSHLLASVRASLVALLVVAPVGSGCLSNEYRIPQDELRRLANQPAELRGQRVRVVQDLGQRRDEAVDVNDVAMASTPAKSDGEGDALLLRGDFYLGPGAWRQDVPGRMGSGPSPSPVRVAPTVRAGVGGRAAIPARRATGGGLNLGGCCSGGGGGSGGDALVALAVVVVGAALLGTIGLAASEGARFDGYAAVAPDQYLYLEDAQGRVTEGSLATLSPEQAAATVEAKLMDDEGAGLRRLENAPLDRRGGAFKLELGTTSFRTGSAVIDGPMAHIQMGAFLTRHIGILAELGLSGGFDCCLGTVVRHSLALELDILPVSVGRLHAGIFGKGGVALIGAVGDRASGPMGGGGVLFEVDLTPRMALVLRGGVNAAQLDTGWSSATTFTAGLAIY